MKTAVRLVGLICVVALAWALIPLAAQATFTSQDMGAYILWSQDSTHTYFQQYKADYSWKDSTTTNPSDFNYMGKLADLATLLFDGAGHKFQDNNYSYSFNDSSGQGIGVWYNTSLSLNQYGYNYNSGQWYDQGNWGGWQTLGSTDLSTAFMGGGASQTLGNNWSYLFDGTYGIWQNGNMNNVNQYAYNYTTGNWYDQGNWGGWAYLGSAGLSASFIGDTTSHSLGSNWSYLFDGTYGYWQNENMNNVNQYAYNYTTGNWYDQGNWGGWGYLGTSTLSASFMGDGSPHAFDSTWSYLFDGTYGYWNNGNMGITQFAYNYTTGNWFDQGNWGGWGSVGPSALSASFMGDGSSHPCDSTWSYMFDGTYGYWNNGNIGLNQFAYDYSAGNWYDQGTWGGWATLGPSTLSASFMGDGSWHTLDSTWSYMLDPNSGGIWQTTWLGYGSPGGTTIGQFAYTYGEGQWFTRLKPGVWSQGDWQSLSSSGLSAAFIADGNQHDLGVIGNYDWSYYFNGIDGIWHNASWNMDLFGYNYGWGQWFDQGTFAYNTALLTTSYLGGFGTQGGPQGVGGWQPLGPDENWYSSFVGDGSWHTWGWKSYAFDPRNGTPSAGSLCGFWKDTGNLRLAYDYSTGMWYDTGPFNGVNVWQNPFPSGDDPWHPSWSLTVAAALPYDALQNRANGSGWCVVVGWPETQNGGGWFELVYHDSSYSGGDPNMVYLYDFRGYNGPEAFQYYYFNEGWWNEAGSMWGPVEVSSLFQWGPWDHY